MGPKKANKKVPAARPQLRSQEFPQLRTQELFSEPSFERFGRIFGITPDQVRAEMDMDDVPLANRPHAFETPPSSQNQGPRQQGNRHDGPFSSPAYDLLPPAAPVVDLSKATTQPVATPPVDVETRNKPACIHCNLARRSCWGVFPAKDVVDLGEIRLGSVKRREGFTNFTFKKDGEGKGDGGG